MSSSISDLNQRMNTGRRPIEPSHYACLLAQCETLPAARTAVAYPCSADALAAVYEAMHLRLIEPILFGPRARLESLSEEGGYTLSDIEIVETADSRAAASRAVQYIKQGRADILMKGSLHTDELMHEVSQTETGLRTGRRISHVFAMNVPTYHKPLFITDAAINIAPSLSDKRDICQNAIDMARALGIAQPKVAILSAVETVTEKIPSTLDAAALCMMSLRGQIEHGCLDGPLAFDNAISAEAARIKGIRSEVAGEPDILLVPDLVSGNMLAKQLTFLANAGCAGIVLGASVPIVLTSRADSVHARIGSCAIAVLLAYRAAPTTRAEER
jgi:phosphotransacetylase